MSEFIYSYQITSVQRLSSIAGHTQQLQRLESLFESYLELQKYGLLGHQSEASRAESK